MEGSFGTGRPNAARRVSLHDSSPLQDETLLEVTEAAYAVNKGGTVRNRPLLTIVSKGLFYFAKPVMQNLTTLFVFFIFCVGNFFIFFYGRFCCAMKMKLKIVEAIAEHDLSLEVHLNV